MPRSARPLALLFSAALIAGCGSSASDQPAPSRKTAPKASTGELRVGVTDGGIGTAATGDKNGIKRLPGGIVKEPSNTQQGVGAGASCQNTDVMPAPDTIATVVASTLCLLNGERRDAGLRPLTENPKLAVGAIAHSQEMVDRQYFDHVGKDGTDPVDRARRAGYIPASGAWTVGENLAWGTGVLATPREIVQAWMKSTGHRENILRPTFKEIGFGVAVGNPRRSDGSGATYTTEFGGITGGTSAVRARSARAKRRARRARAARRARIAKRTRSARATASFAPVSR